MMPDPLRGRPGRADGWERDAVWELSANLDNFNPEGMDLLFDRFFAAGALDVFAAAIQMKKSRPGLLLTALAEPGRVEAVERVFFAETPTLGVRRALVFREKLPRRLERVRTPYGMVRFKVARIAPGEEKGAPEFEDLREAAERHAVPLRRAREAALRAFEKREAKNGRRRGGWT